VPALAELLAERIAAAPRSTGAPLVVGLTGPQGSGKSTLAAALPSLLAGHGLRAAVLALDDLYLPKADRERLAREVHPLFATRGVPGTHEPALGEALLARLGQPGETAVPSFDKGADDRLPPDAWRRLSGRFDVIVFEGWCVGARPQPADALTQPVNDLERDEDSPGIWRRAVNEALATTYRPLFEPIGFQILLRPPGFETVFGWRRQQELPLRADGRGQSDAELARFIQHYQRLTRWIDTEMPTRADVTVQLGPARDVIAVSTPTMSSRP
jgi:D-glycerate 3-kinase